MAKIKVTAAPGLKVRLPFGLAVQQPDYLEHPDTVQRAEGDDDDQFARRTMVEVDDHDAFVVVGLRTGDLIAASPKAQASRADVLKPEEIAKLKTDNNITTATDFDLQMPSTTVAKKGD